MLYRQELKIPFAYDVVFTRDLFATDNTTLCDVLPAQRSSRIAFFIDEGVLRHWPQLPDKVRNWCAAFPEHVQLAGTPMQVPGGEEVKNDLLFVQRMTHQFQRLELCRHSFVVAIGGGAMLDAVGLAAAVFHRGLRLIRVPTTVLSQDDSGVGVKNGINLDGVKNLIGTFAPPWAVLNDLTFLTTLEVRDWSGGLSEAFKVGCIKDKALIDLLEKHALALQARDLNAMQDVVERCAILHLQHIRDGGDPFEFGSARPLDFGHWSAHKLESMTQHAVRHGEAVGIGVALDLFIAAELGFISAEDRDRICRTMETCGLALWHPALLRRTKTDRRLEIVQGLEEFRQHLGGALTLTMPDGIGKKREIHRLSEVTIERGICWLEARQSAMHASMPMPS